MVTVDFLKNKEVVVYGTGINAVKCVCYLESQGISINYVIDGREGIGKFKNYSVYEPSKQRLDKKYIVVACAEKTYSVIKERLCGYQEFKDYVYYGWLNKKMVFLHGNCHMDIIEDCLCSSKSFHEKYAVYPTPRVCTKEKIDKTILAYMDVWVHEDIRSNNKIGFEISDEYLRRFIDKDVFEIIVPHLYGLGACIFPYAKEWNDRNTALLNGAYENGMFPFRDMIIDKCMEANMSFDQICRYVCEDNIVSEEYILDNFNRNIEKIREREKSWDVKILDFILEHYKTEKLFYDKGHPTNIILEKVSRNVLQLLGIQDKVSSSKKLDYHEIPVYPWICKVLGMKWTESQVRASDEAIKSADLMDVSEYVREYIWWCYPEKAGMYEISSFWHR